MANFTIQQVQGRGVLGLALGLLSTPAPPLVVPASPTAPPFDYAALAAEVAALLAEFGQKCVLKRATPPGAVDVAFGRVAAAPQTYYEAWAVVVEYEEKLIDGVTIKRGDRQAYLQAVQRPRIGDRLATADGVEWALEDYSAIDPAGTALVYIVRLRR